MPDNVRALRGNPGKRTSPKTVKLTPAAPQPPDDLDGEALAEWRRVAPELDGKGLLAVVDRGVLTSYCVAWAHARHAEQLLDGGLVVTDRDGDVRKSPAWQVWREATTLAATLGDRLLLSPQARLRAPAPVGDEPPNDPYDLLD